MEQDEQDEGSTAPVIVDELILPLNPPLKLGTEEITELHLREPTVGELEAANAAGPNQVTVSIKLISLITKQPQGLIRRLRQRQLSQIADFFGQFGEAAPKADSEM